MKLSEYNGKYVRITDTDGNCFSGRAKYGDAEFLACEWGPDEDGIFIEDVMLCRSQIESIEEIVPHGTAELWTEHLVLRRCCLDDAGQLYACLGAEPEMDQYFGENPYVTPERTQETLRRLIDSYHDERSYAWVMDVNGDDVLVGTIGAYGEDREKIAVGFRVGRAWQGRGFATEALKTVLAYLTENEGIRCVTARCAAENTGARKVMEKSGMQLVKIERAGLSTDDRLYDKLIYEYRSS